VSLRDSIVIDLASHYKNSLSEKIGLIKEAISEHRLIEFDYYYAKGTTHRKIEPYYIAFKWSSWYVYGFCTERRDFRVFKLNRLWALALTDDAFAVRDLTEESFDLDGGLPDENAAALSFDPSVRYRLIEDYGLDSFTEASDGRLLFTVRYTNRGNVISWILGFGDKALVLSPPELAEEIRRIAENIAGAYERT